jgi:hypothetical protein
MGLQECEHGFRRARLHETPMGKPSLLELLAIFNHRWHSIPSVDVSPDDP